MMSARLKRPTPKPGVDAQEMLDVMGVPTIVKHEPADVDVLVAEQIFPAHHCSPAHSPSDDDMLIYMLEGEITVVVEDAPKQIKSGSCVALPRGRVRSFRNDGAAAAKGLFIAHPGMQAIELFRNLDRAGSAAIASGKSLPTAEIDQIASQYGVQIQRS